mmetsp:Transcript_116753/g.302581  ORF Transcript_116753/g.302581 Transcript_116753/m.302581 type:complete len:279 (-) Transcript_116753:496-1332(-)
MHAALPCGSAASTSSASCASFTVRTQSTGPKISSRIAGWSFISGGNCRTVGPTQCPLFSSAQLRPSTKTVAPSLSAALMWRTIRSCAALSMTGPTWPPSWPRPSALAFAQTFSRSFGWSPMVRRIAAAMQRWPEQPLKDTTMSDEAISMSQSGAATRWFFAPPRQSAFFPAAVARWWTNSATEEEPTKVKAAISLWSHKASTTSRPPLTIWKAPLGTPAWIKSSAARAMVMGTFSLGLRMTVLPETRAIGTVHIGTMKGKLHGAMQVTTPTGSRISWQ